MRFNASAIAMLPSLVAGTLLKAPLKLPIGVRTALTMTLCCMLIFSPGVLTSCSLQLNLRGEYCPPAITPCRTSFAPDARPYLPGIVLLYTSDGEGSQSGGAHFLRPIICATGNLLADPVLVALGEGSRNAQGRSLPASGRRCSVRP